jgi:hypothetical protein
MRLQLQRYLLSCKVRCRRATLVRTLAVVALTRPPCHRPRRSPKSSTAHANVACGGSKDAEVPSKRRGSPLGLLSCGCLEIGVAIHMGIMRSRYERSFCPSRPVGSFAYAFAERRGYFARNIGAVSRVSVRFLTVDVPPRVKYTDGPSTTPHGLDNCKEWSKRLPRRAPSSIGRGHCRVTPLSRRCRVLW